MKLWFLLSSIGLVLSQGEDVEFVSCRIVPRIPRFQFRNVSALGVAILFNSTEDIETFLKSGCDVNYDGVYREYEETGCANKALFERLNIPCRRTVRFEGYTPLILAALSRNVDSVRRLLKVPGVDVNAASTDQFYSTPIASAVQIGNLEMVQLLVGAGADLNARVEKEKLTLLMVALRIDSLPMVRYLLRNGVDVNAADERGFTSLAWALEKEDPEYTKVLAEAGADLNRAQGPGQEPPLVYAVRNNNTEVVKFLLQNRLNIEAGDAKGRTPLFTAALNGRVDIMAELIKAGADVNAKVTEVDSSAIFAAVVSGNPEAVSFLIRNGADVNAQETGGNGNGFSPAYYAADEDKDVRIMELLLEAGADINVQSGSLRWSPLMRAAYEGNVEVVRFLKDNGADLYLEDKDGDTALDLAELKGNIEISRILREK